MSDVNEVTLLLIRARQGDREAFHALFPLIYDELHRLAQHRLAGQAGHTLSATALVHEAFLKMAGDSSPSYADRTHFFAVAATAIRQILVDHARRARAHKRGAGAVRVELSDQDLRVESRIVEILALDEALSRLAELSERMVRVVELRYFAGLSVEETAAMLQVDERTVKRDWRKARAFLYRALAGDAEAPDSGDPGGGASR